MEMENSDRSKSPGFHFQLSIFNCELLIKHFLFVQFFDFIIAQAEKVARNFMSVLAHQRRDAADFSGRFRHSHRYIFSDHFAGFGFIQVAPDIRSLRIGCRS